MPYIGQRPSKGDENNFKILDDISSYTLTFDGSDSSVVSAANDTITSLTHRFVQGQRVTYNNGGGSNIAGLTSGTVYFIIKEDHNTIKLATSASNASNGVAVNITGVGGGSSHTLNVAFDGVNTKFKATHTNGQKARITRSAQLVISINGVIQQPHDTATPSTGFGFDLDGTIVLSQAPVAGDIYWAHVLTNNNVTFDISDNDIDNFTGNGSTVSFNLSKSPPDNRNVLVTIDGVIQYPNDPDGTVRSYTVVENVLTFVTAPASGVEIQVRHIGFAGSSSGSGSGGVTSFYGRTGAVVLKNTDNIVANNAEFAGNLTVQGTMTTLDTKVTEVDQLEVAANNTTVGVAITQSGTGDILNLYDGSTEVFSVADGGNVTITDSIIHSGDTNTKIRFPANDTFSVETAGSERLHITSTGGNVVGKLGVNNNSPVGELDIANRIRFYSAAAANTPGSNGNATRFIEMVGSNSGNATEIGAIKFTNTDSSTYQAASIASFNEGGSNDGNLVFNISDGGTAATGMKITSTGKVGINESANINGRLHIQHDALEENILYASRYNQQSDDKPVFAVTQAQMTNMASAGLVIGNHNMDIHLGPVFGANAGVSTHVTKGIRIGVGYGQVGINTNVFSQSYSALTVKNAVTSDFDTVLDIVADDDKVSRLEFSETSNSGKGSIRYSYASDANFMSFYTNGTAASNERLRITSDGKVGINTVNPLTQVDIYATPIESATINTTNSTQLGLWVRAKNPSNTTGNIYTGITLGEGRAGLYAYDDGGGAAHGMGFWTGSNSGVAEKLRINSSGQVGICTQTIPSDAALHIGLDGAREYLRLDADAGNNAYIEIQAPNNRRKAIIFKSGGTRRGVIGVGDSDEATNATSLFFSASDKIAGNDPHMVITSAGKMGLGTAAPIGDLEIFNESSGVVATAVVRGEKALVAIMGDSNNSGASETDASLMLTSDSHTTLTSPLSAHGYEIGLINAEPGSGLRLHDGTAQTERLRIDTGGRLLIGHNANIQVDGSNPRVQLTGTSDSTAHLSINYFNASAVPPTISLAKSRGGIGVFSAVQDDDVLGKINFIGADGTDLAEVAGKILVACDAAVANNRVPSRMEFHTTDGNGNLDLNMVLTRDGHLYLPQGITRDAMFALAHNSADDFILGRTTGGADTGMTIVTPSATSGFINFADADGQRQGSILYQHGSGQDKMYLRTNNNQTGMVIDSSQNIGVGADPPQTKLNVIGTISTGRNIARELGTIINISSNYNGARSGGNVINGVKNYEVGTSDWITASSQRVNANLTIDLGGTYTCDRFVIYNQNEYSHSNREVKNFTLEGSNDNSNWTTVLDDDCGCSHGHEPNPGFSFRIPQGFNDDSEGNSYRYWRFTMKSFHGSDAHGGVMELELYQAGTSSNVNATGSEITTHSLVASDVHSQTIDGLVRIGGSKGLNFLTGQDASDTWEITETSIITNGSYQDKSTIRHKRGVMAVSSAYNSGDLFIRIDNLYNLPGNAWWNFSVLVISSEVAGTLAGGHNYVTSLQVTGLSAWNSLGKTDIVGTMNVSVSSHGSNFVELFVNVNDSSRGPCTVICNGGPGDPPRISFH